MSFELLIPLRRCSSALCSRGSAACWHRWDSRLLVKRKENHREVRRPQTHPPRRQRLNILHGIMALTRWGDGLAARGGERRAGHQAAGRVRGRVSEGPHGVTGAHVVHGHAVGEGVAHRAVGLTVVAADLLRFPAGVLGRPHQCRLA